MDVSWHWCQCKMHCAVLRSRTDQQNKCAKCQMDKRYLRHGETTERLSDIRVHEGYPIRLLQHHVFPRRSRKIQERRQRKRRRMALMWDMRRHMNHANQVVRTFGEHLRRQYGFLADPSLPTWRNVVRRIRELSVDDCVASNVGNLACHNLLQNLPLPPGTTKLLGLGLNYCIKPSSTTNTTVNTITRMKDDKKPLADFEKELRKEQLSINRRRKPSRNITYSQWKLIAFFKGNDLYIVVQGDKNLGPCILDRKYYILRGCQEHLSNTANYRQLSRATANALQRGLMYKFWRWFCKYSPPGELESPKEWVCFSEAEVTFLGRAGRRNIEYRQAC
eukprot:scaffold112213_cov44-Cyclotella_meneghiniana.AAC.8